MLTTSKRKNVYNKLKEAIADGSFPPGSRLPNEPELAEVLGVSRLTLRYVLAQLETENTLVRIKGKGTFVKDVREERLRILVVMANIPNFTQEATLLNELYKVGEAHNALLDPVEPAVVRNMSDSEIKELFSSGRYRGMIYISFNLDEPEELRSIWKKLQVPSVFFFFNSRFTPPRMPGNALIVNCDVPGMIREALTCLRNRGYRKTALILNGNLNSVSPERVSGLLELCGMVNDEKLIFSGSSGLREFGANLIELLHSDNPPTAICCGSSVMALQLYHLLNSHNIPIPGKTAVIAVGQTPLGAGLFSPSLTTVFCQWHEFAVEAWKYLSGAVVTPGKGVNHPPKVILKNYLFERQSIGNEAGSPVSAKSICKKKKDQLIKEI
jgi:DNA-binding LacI/PurR family transcriptional regulator